MKKIEKFSAQQDQIKTLLKKSFSAVDHLTVDDLDALQELLDQSNLLPEFKNSLTVSIDARREDISWEATMNHYFDDEHFIGYFLALFRIEYGVSYDHMLHSIVISWELFENLHEE